MPFVNKKWEKQKKKTWNFICIIKKHHKERIILLLNKVFYNLFQASSTSTAAPQPGYCLGTGVSCPVCDPAASAAYIFRRHRRQGETNMFCISHHNTIYDKKVSLLNKCGYKIPV